MELSRTNLGPPHKRVPHERGIRRRVWCTRVNDVGSVGDQPAIYPIVYAKAGRRASRVVESTLPTEEGNRTRNVPA